MEPAAILQIAMPSGFSAVFIVIGEIRIIRNDLNQIIARVKQNLSI